MNDLIEEFYNVEGKNYDISLEECNLICGSPFKFIKEILNRGLLKSIRLQYFGVFEISQNKIKYSKKNLEEGYNKGTILESRYLKRKEVLDRYKTD